MLLTNSIGLLSSFVSLTTSSSRPVASVSAGSAPSETTIMDDCGQSLADNGSQMQAGDPIYDRHHLLAILYRTRGPARQPISQKSVSSRVASLKIAISSASRAGVA